MTNTILTSDLEYIYSRLPDKAAFKGSRFLLTGCAGFLGFTFANFLSTYADTLGIESIVGLDTFTVGRPPWLDRLAESGKMQLLPFDIAVDSLEKVPNAEEITHVIHMASIASPVYYRKYPLKTIDANVWGLRRILDFYADRGLQGLLYFSSSEIYGDPTPENIPTKEDYRGLVACQGPRACYDESKRFCETLCWVMSRQTDIPIAIARPFSVATRSPLASGVWRAAHEPGAIPATNNSPSSKSR